MALSKDMLCKLTQLLKYCEIHFIWLCCVWLPLRADSVCPVSSPQVQMEVISKICGLLYALEFSPRAQNTFTLICLQACAGRVCLQSHGSLRVVLTLQFCHLPPGTLQGYISLCADAFPCCLFLLIILCCFTFSGNYGRVWEGRYMGSLHF